MDRAKEGIRRQDFAILVEGYMDAIAVASAGISNVVASCGTSLAEPQIKLLGRFTRRVVVNYDPDAAGQTATERSLVLLLEQDFEVRVLALPPVGNKKADPDLFIAKKARGVSQTAQGGAAVCGLPDCTGEADGFDHRRRKAARGKFSLLTCRKSPTASCARNGQRESRSSFGWTSRCCERR